MAAPAMSIQKTFPDIQEVHAMTLFAVWTMQYPSPSVNILVIGSISGKNLWTTPPKKTVSRRMPQELSFFRWWHIIHPDAHYNTGPLVTDMHENLLINHVSKLAATSPGCLEPEEPLPWLTRRKKNPRVPTGESGDAGDDIQWLVVLAIRLFHVMFFSIPKGGDIIKLSTMAMHAVHLFQHKLSTGFSKSLSSFQVDRSSLLWCLHENCWKPVQNIKVFISECRGRVNSRR